MAQGSYLSKAEQEKNAKTLKDRRKREQQEREAEAKRMRSGLARSQGPSGGPTYTPTRGGPNRSGKPAESASIRVKAKKGGVPGTMIKGRPETWKADNPTPAAAPKQPQAPQQPQAPRSPAVGAPVHAAPSAFAKNSQVQGGVLSAAPPAPPAGGSAYAPQAGAAPKPNTPQASSYRDGGKGLYKGSEEYVKATGGNYNPLMQRTFGYQTGQHPGAQPPAQPAAPAAPAPQQPMSPQYQGNDEPGALGQAENPMAALGQFLSQRKKLTISMSN